MSPDARDLVNRLLCPDPQSRLGSKGVHEIKAHPFFDGIDWDNLYKESRTDLFIPRLTDPTDTGYFDLRGNDDGSDLSGSNSGSEESDVEENEDGAPANLGPQHLMPRKSVTEDQFVNFSYKSLPSLADLNRLHHGALSPATPNATGAGITLLNNSVKSVSSSHSVSDTKISDSDADDERDVLSD